MSLVHGMSGRALLDGFTLVDIRTLDISFQETSLSFIVAMTNPISNFSVFIYHETNKLIHMFNF